MARFVFANVVLNRGHSLTAFWQVTALVLGVGGIAVTATVAIIYMCMRFRRLKAPFSELREPIAS